ncbi:MAG: caspase family protein, partial [Rhodocyclaceae bacterium]|nr:caspase family protein [Rhodocyclaceae bacterium]
VTRLTDADQTTMKRALLEFGRALRAGDVDAGLFFYAGHGVQVKGENYLVPVNARIDSEDEIDLEGINVNDFLQVMNSANSKINIVILDACRNNPFARSFRAVSRGLAPVDAPKGTLIAYATAPGDVALDGTGNNSPYTLALTQAIRQGQGATVESVFKATRRDVLAATGDRQVPWETSSVTGDFYFTPGDGKPPAPQPSAESDMVR